MHNYVVRVRISEELKNKLEESAKKNDYSNSEFVRQAIREKIKKLKK
jgi:predicted transcriptional regulator